MPNSKPDDYEVLSIIGSGTYGICKKIRRKSDGKIRVWKELDYGSMSNSEKQLLVSEVNLLRELKHENIVRYHDRIIDKVSTKIYIIMEFCPGGDLAELVLRHKKTRKYIDESFVWKVLYQIASALRELHNYSSKATKSVLHRDLKPANVFLDANNDCKLGDFGLARVLHDTSLAQTYVGTPYYMSPELANGSTYNVKSDIWSLGCLVYELCTLLPPFLAGNQKMLALKIKDGHYKPIPHLYSTNMQKIIKQMLTVEETIRPTVEDILTSPFILANIKQLSDGTTSTSLKHSTTELQKKEEMLQNRESKVIEREKELNLREEILNEREKAFKEKLLRMQSTKTDRYSTHVLSDKENLPYLNRDINLGKYERGLHMINRNLEPNRYADIYPSALGGLR